MQTVRASISPETLEATLEPGQSITETKTVIVSLDFWDYLYYDCWNDYGDVIYLYLEVIPSAYESWVSVSPLEYEVPFDSGDEWVFEVTITVPPGTPPGDYNFEIQPYGWWWDYYYEEEVNDWVEPPQTVTIHVPPIQVIPEYPFGTILGVIACLAALAVFCVPRLKMRPELKT